MDGSRLHRLPVLERLLGIGRFQITDSGHGPRRQVRWTCGCEAHEAETDEYTVAACADHRDELLPSS